MKVTEVVDAAEHIHAVLQGLAMAGEVAGPPKETGQALAEGGLEPFNIGRVDHPATLGGFQQAIDHCLFALQSRQSLLEITLIQSVISESQESHQVLDQVRYGSPYRYDDPLFYHFLSRFELYTTCCVYTG